MLHADEACLPLQLDVLLREWDLRWHCERSFSLTLADGRVEIFFIDTSPGVASYRMAPWAVNPGPAFALTCLNSSQLGAQQTHCMRNHRTLDAGLIVLLMLVVLRLCS